MAEQADEDLFISSLTVAEVRRGVLEAPAGLTNQPAPEPPPPFMRRRASVARVSTSDGVSHSTKAASTPSSTS